MFFFNSGEENLKFSAKSIEHAYIAILNDDLETAFEVFKSNDSPRALWGISFTGILSGFIERYPSYFEIRNFLEIDLDFLIKNEKISYIEYVLGSLKFLSSINQEVYKYTARVMYENKYYSSALEYMEKSKKLFYKDPELHYMLAKYYLREAKYSKADYYLDECLKIIKDYNPALKMKKEISKYLV